MTCAVIVRPAERPAGNSGTIRENTVSLNRKRRIFRPSISPVPRHVVAMPPLGVIIAAGGGVATMLLVAWLFVRPTYAPALAPISSQIGAPAAQLAVVDGDTLRLGQQVVRLNGIAAPPRGTDCGSVDCGAAAANALSALIGNHTVDCRIEGHDRQGRPLGTCQASGVELNEALVRDGWAHAIAASLRRTEDDARKAGRGIWRNSL
jgi:endonuclease YncB( thermonuclease family)